MPGSMIVNKKQGTEFWKLFLYSWQFKSVATLSSEKAVQELFQD